MTTTPMTVRNIRPGSYSPLDEGEAHGFHPLEDVLVVAVSAEPPPGDKLKWPVRFTGTFRSLQDAAAVLLLPPQATDEAHHHQEQDQDQLDRWRQRRQAYVLCGLAADVARCLAELPSLYGLHAPLYALADEEVALELLPPSGAAAAHASGSGGAAFRVFQVPSLAVGGGRWEEAVATVCSLHMATVPQMILRQAVATPHEVAISGLCSASANATATVPIGGATERCSYTYLQLCEYAWQLGEVLEARYGLRPAGKPTSASAGDGAGGGGGGGGGGESDSGAGTRVALIIPPSPLYAVVTLALGLRGMHPCVVQAAPAALRRYQLQQAPCLAVLTVAAKQQEADRADAAEAGGGGATGAAAAGGAGECAPPVIQVDALFDELFRAGAWGYPEGTRRVIASPGHLQELLRSGAVPSGRAALEVSGWVGQSVGRWVRRPY